MERGVGVSVSSGSCVMGTRGEVAGSASVCARGVCVDPAECFSPTVHAAPALACGRALPPGEVEQATAQASRLAAALSSECQGWRGPGGGVCGGGWGGEGGYTMPLLRVRAALLPEREGHDPKGGIPSTCTRYPRPEGLDLGA